ncbi:arrestin domain-containing protein 1-like isoform X1 [Ciona intestinalis]
MSELLSFTIAFDGNKIAYTGGEIVSGCALIVLNAPMNVRAVNIKFVGKSKVMWTVQQDKTSTTYSDSETYFDNSLCVYGQGCIGLYQNATQLPAGQSCFPFQFQLPAQLPASLEAAHGSVRYDVFGVINRPNSRDCKTNVQFSVYDLLDLNHIQNIRMPIHMMDSKHRCCCC